jgi:hypothetical protein
VFPAGARDFSLNCCIQAGPSAHQASFLVRTGNSVPENKVGGAHLHSARDRMSGAVPSLPSVFMTCLLTFYYLLGYLVLNCTLIMNDALEVHGLKQLQPNPAFCSIVFIMYKVL